MSRRHYSSVATDTTLTGPIGTSDTSFTVVSLAGYPGSFPYTAVLDAGTNTEEVVEVTAASGATVTVTRAVDGTTAKNHTVGATFIHGVSARDYDEGNAHVNATSAVHGVTGAVLGTGGTQTVTGDMTLSGLMKASGQAKIGVNGTDLNATGTLVNNAGWTSSGTLSVIDGTHDIHYHRVSDKLVRFTALIGFGASTVAAGGFWSFALPVGPAVATFPQVLAARFKSFSGSVYSGLTAEISASGTSYWLMVGGGTQRVGPTFVTNDGVTHTVASGDTFVVSGLYEIA